MTKENKELLTALSLLDAFHKIDREIPIQQQLLFLQIAANEGITMPEVAKLVKDPEKGTPMPQGTISRNVKALSVYLKNDPKSPDKRVRAGYALIDARPDMSNRKSLALYLTPKGKQLVKQIEELIRAAA